MPIVRINQIPDDYAESTGLANYNKSRMPGCRDIFQAALNGDGRFQTGLDEDAYNVEYGSDEYKRIKTTRETLEKKTGLDLKGKSEFWYDFKVILESDRLKVFNTDKPLDQIALTILVANKNVAPDKDAANTTLYRSAQYYAFTEENEAKEEITVRKIRDKAILLLVGISEDKDKMVLFGSYLEGIKYSNKLSEATLYKMLRSYIEDKDIKNATSFTDIFKKSVSELQQKIIVDKALKQRLINKVNVGNKKQVYQYGQVTVGSTIEEVYKNLSLPDFAPELMALKADIDKR